MLNYLKQLMKIEHSYELRLSNKNVETFHWMDSRLHENQLQGLNS